MNFNDLLNQKKEGRLSTPSEKVSVRAYLTTWLEKREVRPSTAALTVSTSCDG